MDLSIVLSLIKGRIIVATLVHHDIGPLFVHTCTCVHMLSNTQTSISPLVSHSSNPDIV